jgi:protein-S-isoprenylcysteine O-methyltransferase Ste14
MSIRRARRSPEIKLAWRLLDSYVMQSNQIDNPGVIARPPRIYLGFLIAGVILDRVWPAVSAAQPFGGSEWFLVAAVLIVIGAAMLTSAMGRFRAAGTNVPTPMPSTALVTNGLYSLSRNPIYISLTLIYLGLAVAFDSVWSVILLVPILILMRYGVIAREERYLERKFNAAYVDYRNRVRRWI